MAAATGERKTVAVFYESGDSQVFTCNSFDVVRKDGGVEEVTAVMASSRSLASGVDEIASVWEVDET